MKTDKEKKTLTQMEKAIDKMIGCIKTSDEQKLPGKDKKLSVSGEF